MSYEYKCVGAPERPKRQRGVRGRSDRVALAMQEIIAVEAVDGWEYQRTDLVPVEERVGLFSRLHEVHRAVMVFRRPLEPAPRPMPARRGRADASPEAPLAAESKHPVRGATAAGSAAAPAAGMASGPAAGGDQRMALSAERDDPPPSRQPEDNSGTSGPGRRRTPTGLG